jgi:hypothetical protein
MVGRAFFLTPNVAFDFYPIKPVSISNTQLARELYNSNKIYKTGFLALDKFRRVQPLAEKDSLVFVKGQPTVGIWFADLPSKG